MTITHDKRLLFSGNTKTERRKYILDKINDENQRSDGVKEKSRAKEYIIEIGILVAGETIPKILEKMFPLFKVHLDWLIYVALAGVFFWEIEQIRRNWNKTLHRYTETLLQGKQEIISPHMEKIGEDLENSLQLVKTLDQNMQEKLLPRIESIEKHIMKDTYFQEKTSKVTDIKGVYSFLDIGKYVS